MHTISSFASTLWQRFFGITCFSVSVLWVSPSNAQITRDSTLPNNSDVNLQGNTILIEGGTTAGKNLFHSFKEFSVPTGTEAYFNNSVDINNILTRVTGGSISNIDGLIKANGTANLFLINPAGIVFGENAILDIGGSFVGTTADALAFDEKNFFSASNPENSSSLLQINPNALFFNQLNSQASIQSNSTADVGLENILVPGIDSSFFTSSGLRVADGKSLLLVGGNVTIDGGGLTALGGRVELGGLAGKGRVGLNVDGNNLSLSFPTGVERSDVAIVNNAGVRVIGDDGGSIGVNARNLEITNESFLFAGIDTGNGSEQSKAGNIDINATGGIKLNDISFIHNYILPGAKGQGGNINISTKTLQVEGIAEISTSTFDVGASGDITIEAQNIQLIGGMKDSSLSGFSLSGLFTTTESTGNAGGLNIKTNTLLVKDGAQVSASTFGDGASGDITIEAQNIQLIGENKNGLPSGLFITTDSTGDASRLNIKTNTLIVKDGAEVSASTVGAGAGGDITIDAQDIQLIGERKDGFPGGLFSITDSTGDAGGLNIKTNTLLVKDGAEVSVSTFSEGEGGDISVEAEDIQLIGKDFFLSGLFTTAFSTGDAGGLNIKTNTLLVKDGAEINASSVSQSSQSNAGAPGSITIEAEDIQLIGERKVLNDKGEGFFPSGSGLFTTTESILDVVEGLNIKTKTLLVKDGAEVSASNFGEGAGGNINVEAQDIQLIGESTNSSPSGFSTTAFFRGDAGDLNIKTNTLLVKDGAEVSASTFSEGTGGDINIEAQDIQLIGERKNGLPGGIFTTGGENPIGEENLTGEENPTGNGGNLEINANTLLVKDGARVSASTFGEGAGGDLEINANILKVENGARISAEGSSTGIAGNLFINANSIRLNNNVLLTAGTGSNKLDSQTEQATININAQDLIMRRGSNIFTNAKGENVVGGNININADIIAAFENSDISANSEESRGGNVTINTQGIFGTQFRPQPTNLSDITATGASDDLSGNVEIINPDIDPNTGLVNLPSIPVETEVAQGCTAGSSIAQSRFEIIGRGGLPTLPTDALSADAVQVDLVSIKPEINKPLNTNVSTKPKTSTPKKIVEATGWVRNKKGEIFFVAYAANQKQVDNWYKNNHCRR